MKATFRRAEAIDVNDAVPLIYASGPAAFEYVFKVSEQKAAQDFLKYVFVRSGSEFSYDNHTCVIGTDGGIVGIGAAFGKGSMFGFTMAAIKYIIQFYGIWQGIEVIKRGLAIEKIITPPKGNTEVLVHLSIKPEFRRRGLGSQLIRYFEEKAKAKNRESASLDVSAENKNAMFLYERMGFEISKENISNLRNEFSYVADHYKMHKTL